MKKGFLNITPDSGGSGSTTVTAVADPNAQPVSRTASINFSASGGVSRAVSAEQSSIPFFPQLGLTMGNDSIANNNANFSLNAFGYAVKQNDTTGMDNDETYIVIKMNADLMNWSSEADTTWFMRGALCILSSLVGSKDLYMEVLYKENNVTNKTNIVQFSPENSGIPGYTAYYARQSIGITPPSKFQSVRFAIGDPAVQGAYHYIVEYDFLS